MIKQWKKVLVSIVSLAIIMMSTAPPLLAAQEPTGAIEGTITDPQGSVVTGAEVIARNVATNQSRSANTGSDGRYRIGQLTPGVYEVRVTGQGFKSSVATDIQVTVGSNVPLDLALEVGGSTETVTVVGGGEAQIDRTDNTVAGVVGTIQIENLPLNGRNFLDLAQLQPGTETVAGGSFDPTKANYTGISIAGQAGRSTQITVDGGSVVDNVVGTTVQNFSQEIVQEFQVGISNFDLSTGASASGSVNVISRSGSNDFHGNAYIYWRDDRFAAFPALSRLDAANGVSPDAQTDKIPFDREQFGGSFSGPIKRDKLFFFANAEYNNQDAVALHKLPDFVPGFSGFTGNPFNELLFTGKVDWVVSNKTNMLFRYSHNDNDQQVPFSPGSGIVPRESASNIFTSNDQVVDNRSDGFVVGLTHSFGANVVNDLRYNFNDFHNFVGPATEGVPEIRIFDGGAQTWRSGTNAITPQVTDQSRNQIRDDLVWTKGSHTFRFGGNWERTSITGLFVFANPARIRLFGPGDGVPNILRTEADFLAQPVRDFSFGIGDPNLPFNTDDDATINHRFQFYGNDSWKVTRNFTLNYGLAYRYDNNLWNHDLDRPAIIAPLFTKGTEAPEADKNNIAPRVGFAWDVTGKGRTVIRGGVGMYYDTTIDNLRLFERADLGPPGAQLFLVGADVTSALLPGGDGRFGTTPASANGFLTLAQALALVPSVRADLENAFSQCNLPTSLECGQIRGISPSGPLFSTDFEIPYSIQYAIGFQKELPGNMVFQADFNYRKGVHELLTYDANFNDSVDRNGNPTPLVPSLGISIPYADSSAFSTYKALLVRLDRRFSGGFQLTGSYSLSRLKAFGNDSLGLADAFVTDRNNFRADFGPAGLDRTHRLVISGLWTLPFFKDSSGFKKHVLGDWTISFISTAFSGLPFTAELPDGVDLTGSGAFLSYLPGTGNGSIGRDINSVGELNELIRNYNANRAQFAARIEDGVPVDPFGTPLRVLAELPANAQIGGDSIISQDVRFTKAFRMGESRRLDFIAEVFNLFNVANLTGNADIDFIIPAAEDAAVLGVNTFKPTTRATSVFGTGGPRAFQFALKFTF
ncbi:MAG TPA: carboxypeptidase regulatory-like domain-containing protein [Blastocatellia bacterium]|nr:carboxypeptidase regulatory-like domain-containing protein [Blastocatellia bacterium]